MPTGPPKLLKVDQVAERLQVSPWSVYRLVARGDLPAVKLGTGPRVPIRVDADELQQFVYGQGQRVSARTKAWQ
jgi:excisionase family DNA binding protein